MVGKGFNRHKFWDELKLPWITLNSSFFTDVMVVVWVKIKHHTETPQRKQKHSWIIVIEQTEKFSKQSRSTNSIEKSSYLPSTW